jgi:hypothetical protein
MKCLTLHRIASWLHRFCCPALVTLPCLGSSAVVYYGVTGIQDRWYHHLEGSLASFVHPGGVCYLDAFLWPPMPTAVVAWILGVEVTAYMYVFTPNYATPQRDKLAKPQRSGCSNKPSFRPL